MSRSQVRQNLSKVLTYEDLYDEISEDWEGKARALQARRWRALKRDVKGA